MNRRIGEVLWTLDYLDQIESDLSVFHRVDDAMALPAPRFFKLAALLPAYSGALAARLERERDRLRPPSQRVYEDPAPAVQDAGQVLTRGELIGKAPGLFEIERGG
jgi:hypothetical protein